MEQSDQVYINLQKHLDRQAVGFPATKTGVEIRILKHIFTFENVSTFDEVTTLLQQAEEPFVIIECICRKKSR